MKQDCLYQEDYRSLTARKRIYWLYLWWTWRLVLWLGSKFGRPFWWCGGRHTDGDPTVCQNEECRWVGRVRDCVHGYQDDGSGEDVEGVDSCPKCGEEI